MLPVGAEHLPAEGDEFKDDPPVVPPKPTPQEVEAPPQGLNFLAVRRFWFALSLIFPRWKSFGVLAFIIMFFCNSIYGGLQLLIFQYFPTSTIVNDVVLYNDNTDAFNISGYYLVVNLIGSIVQALSAFTGAMVGVYVQKEVIKLVHANYLSNNVLYTLNNVDKLEGVDSRIVTDLNGMREAMAWLFGNPFSFLNYRLGFFPLLISFIIMIAYSFHLAWALTLFFLASLVGALITQIISSIFTATALNRRQQAEGVLRLHYGRVKNSIESITFFGGLGEELETADVLLESAIHYRVRYAIRAGLTVFPTVAMYYWLSNGEYVMASIIQVYTSSSIVAAQMITIISFCVLMGKIGTQLVQSMGGFGMLAAYTHRIGDVWDHAVEHQKRNLATLDKHSDNDSAVRMKHCSIVAGTGKTENRLLEDLSFELKKDDSIVVMGPTACGKSSIARLLAGLWDPREGTIERPLNFGKGGIFFMPQSNYTTEGSLAEQIVYPKAIGGDWVKDDELSAILNEVGLGYLIDRWTLHKRGIDWKDVLSGGEGQRLGFARMFYHEPAFAVLDESTAALDLALERQCMIATKSRGITLLSIATRLTQTKYHNKLLYLDGKGHYTLEDNSGGDDAAKRRASASAGGPTVAGNINVPTRSSADTTPRSSNVTFHV